MKDEMKVGDILFYENSYYIAIYDPTDQCDNCGFYGMECADILKLNGYESRCCSKIHLIPLVSNSSNEFFIIRSSDLENVLCDDNVCAFKGSCSKENDCLLKLIQKKRL